MNVARIVVLVIAIACGVPTDPWAEDAVDDFQPNDYVDVLLTRKDSDVSNTAQRIKTILTNVRVLAIDRNIGDKDAPQFLIGKRFTLELTLTSRELS